ncbi:hypothetical protein [Nocardia neocaledoniensis]|uniref:hypothetical protein n=1 Tax=Nocardia neocaledoniensis TaxID=236511 RepID=UPI002455BCEA|nr:hypothetical protein [Nocardia neocaledoniensis]
MPVVGERPAGEAAPPFRRVVTAARNLAASDHMSRVCACAERTPAPDACAPPARARNVTNYSNAVPKYVASHFLKIRK